MATTADFKIGQRVYFGRRAGEQTLGEVVKVNATTLKIRQMESRGTMRAHPVGMIWKVPPSLCTPAGDSTPAPATPVVALRSVPSDTSALDALLALAVARRTGGDVEGAKRALYAAVEASEVAYATWFAARSANGGAL